MFSFNQKFIASPLSTALVKAFFCQKKSMNTTIKIISYNLNGIRAALGKGLLQWMNESGGDIFCFQELKAEEHKIPQAEFEAAGYPYCYWFSAQKPGYSGVGIVSKIKPDQVIKGCQIPEYDYEGRVIRADFGDFTLLNAYFPSGTSGDERQAVKMRFLKDIREWVATLKQERPNMVLLGDYNIAHTELDIHNPKGNQKTSGFLPEEREWMTQWFADGFIDAFRLSYPTEKKYSWWSTRFNSRAQNKGWRIDYQSVSLPLREHILSADLLNDAVHSDHCPVEVVYKSLF